ncbi:hypothetical protein [Streptomyces sp. NPDC046942]|uniref:hypothetical protein n=1 Tax=Streptomyces sp. NPDC046942 TaxID=3155137 RepID=UPI0033C11823
MDALGERALARLRRRHVGFVFQSFHPIDESSAVENVEFPALLAGCGRRRAQCRADRQPGEHGDARWTGP